MGCATFTVIGVFVAYFHTLYEVAANGAMAAVCAVILATRLVVSTGDAYLAAAAVAIVATLNIGIPCGILSLVQALRVDLRSSGRDPLTGLHNRRSFHQSAYELMMRHQSTGNHLVVIVIDLDSLKASTTPRATQPATPRWSESARRWPTTVAAPPSSAGPGERSSS